MPQSRIYNDPARMKSNSGTKAQFRELLHEAGPVLEDPLKAAQQFAQPQTRFLVPNLKFLANIFAV